MQISAMYMYDRYWTARFAAAKIEEIVARRSKTGEKAGIGRRLDPRLARTGLDPRSALESIRFPVKQHETVRVKSEQ